MMIPIDPSTPQTEDRGTQIRRRYQQKRCLQCGAQTRATPWALFCTAHFTTHRYCPLCDTVFLSADFGSDRSRCQRCSRARALDHYYANPDRSKYRVRLRQMAKRTGTRGDQLMESMRRRIALAELVKRTPGMSWPARGRLIGRYGPQLAQNYHDQCAGRVVDVDACDNRAKAKAKAKRGRHG